MGVVEAVTTILVADPRQAFQEQIERAVQDYGFATEGQPDVVLTPDSATARFWSRRKVLVVLYEYEDSVDVAGLMVTAMALVDP